MRDNLVSPFDIGNFTVEYVIGANPAAGALYSAASPGNARAGVISLSFKLVTDANVASRYIEVIHNRPGYTSVIGAAYLGQAATETRQYVAHQGGGVSTATPVKAIVLSIPSDGIFLEGHRLDIGVTGIQATDQLSDIRIFWKLWPYEQ